MTQSLFRFRCRQMIPHATRSGLRGVIVVYRSNILPSVFFTLLREFDVADLMVENYYLLGACGFLQQRLNLPIVDLLHFRAIVKVTHRGLLMNELKSLPVERQLFGEAGIAD
jgi:hypothetical protein